MNSNRSGNHQCGLPTQLAHRFGPAFFLLVVLVLLMPTRVANAGPDVQRTQSILLQPGWNAVFLEVDPLSSDPAVVFGGLPVDTVATFFTEAKPVYFPRNPDEHPWQEEGWGVWYAPQRPDAFVSNLNLIRGSRAYMIHATAGSTWNLEGTVSEGRIEWEPDSFTFTGFPVDPDAPPTFARFFAGADAHRGQKILRLVQGRWTLVTDLNTHMRSGEAYWIFSKGASRFQGPIEVKLTAGNRLSFSSSANGLGMELLNAGGAITQFLIETVPTGDGVPLSYEFRELKTLATAYPALPSVFALPPVEPRSKTSLRLFVRREELITGSQTALLKISNGEGSLRWVPVSASSTQTH